MAVGDFGREMVENGCLGSPRFAILPYFASSGGEVCCVLYSLLPVAGGVEINPPFGGSLAWPPMLSKGCCRLLTSCVKGCVKWASKGRRTGLKANWKQNLQRVGAI